MNRCSYCQKQVIRNLKISEILGLGKILPQICEDCSNLFRPINKQQSCRTCQKELPGDITYCEDCIAWKNAYPNYDFSHHACFYYDSAFKEWLKRYKFMGDVRLAGTFAKQLQIIQ
ncbi:competence protein F [Enterococcus hirae]|nr:competence protein F [Enterococcus hirae]VTS67469.1 competence protein F [Enterococcus hirae]